MSLGDEREKDIRDYDKDKGTFYCFSVEDESDKS